jgi:mono/diheme cytochrome c family protein
MRDRPAICCLVRLLPVVEGSPCVIFEKGLPLVRSPYRNQLIGLGVAVSLALPALVGAAPDPRKGPDLFVSQGCVGCHMLNGKGGTMGPDLTHVGKKMNAAAIRKKLENPKAGMPNSIMPAAKDIGMKPAQVADLTAFMASLK